LAIRNATLDFVMYRATVGARRYVALKDDSDQLSIGEASNAR
jgi:hypothetical protein